MFDLFIALTSFATGGALATLMYAYRRTPRTTAPAEPTDCAHVWDGWTEPEYEPIHGSTYEREGVVGTMLTQQRTCLSCGYIEYRQETFYH